MGKASFYTFKHLYLSIIADRVQMVYTYLHHILCKFNIYSLVPIQSFPHGITYKKGL
jgi:hypothetical protein